MNLRYLLLRLIRHFLPESITRFLLRRGLIIRPGLETREPASAVTRYRDALETRGASLTGKRVLIFGYGGNFAVGAELLRAGARHIVLLDRFAPPDDRRNRELVRAYPDYFSLRGEQVVTNEAFLTLIHDDVKNVRTEKFDLVLSSSVYEHLDDVDGLTAALAALTAPSGIHIHYVDLRDHFFQLPFEMLKFSERTWKNWLNPTSNLNRFRLRDYRRVFENYFSDVRINVLAREPETFAKAKSKIRPEFLTGDDAHDTVTLIEVVASVPK
ncbi:MAG: methyltransferase domain-containing protein [Chloroflexota bacterium]